jgi:hypothetical protein
MRAARTPRVLLLPCSGGYRSRSVFNGCRRLDLLRRGERRTERVQQHACRDAANRELCRAVEESAAIDAAVDVLVEEIQQFLIEIAGCFAFHGREEYTSRMELARRGSVAEV